MSCIVVVLLALDASMPMSKVFAARTVALRENMGW